MTPDAEDVDHVGILLRAKKREMMSKKPLCVAIAAAAVAITISVIVSEVFAASRKSEGKTDKVRHAHRWEVRPETTEIRLIVRDRAYG